MTLNVNNSINTFLNALEKRINVLSSDELTENVDNAHINEINIILSKYGIASNQEIKVEDIRKINIEYIKDLLELIGQNKDSIEYLVSKIDEYYEKICLLINTYINEFKNIEKNQNKMIYEKIKLYQKYVNLFENEELTEPFKELNEISKVFSEIGLSDEDKGIIFGYIAESNNKTVKSIDAKVRLKIDKHLESILQYIEMPEVQNIVNNKISKRKIDVDMIPTLTEELANEAKFDYDIMINIVSVLIADDIMKQAEKSNDKNEQKELISIANKALSFIVKLDENEVYLAKEIKEKTYDFYMNAIASGITDANIKEYLETPLSQLESDSISREYAIELKELAVLKPIYETLDTIKDLDKTNEEYKKAVIVLNKLLEQYNFLEEKKNNLIKE